MSAKVAVILSGCGFLDGSEIQEAVLTLLALDNAGASVQCCAPNINQLHVINHVTKSEAGESRNVLVESARICRGNIVDLATVKASDFDALVIPGGYGAAKNLSSYATDGANAKVQPEVERVVREFVSQGKPVCAVCIAPVIMASIFGKDPNVRVALTTGADDSTANDLRTFGAEHVTCPVKEFVVDKKNKIVSTPAYMLGKGPSDVFVGIEKAVKATLELV